MAISVLDLFTIGIGPSQLPLDRPHAGRPPLCRKASRCRPARYRSPRSKSASTARWPSPARATAPTKRFSSASKAPSPKQSTRTKSSPAWPPIRAAGQLKLAGGPTIPFDESKAPAVPPQRNTPSTPQRPPLRGICFEYEWDWFPYPAPSSSLLAFLHLFLDRRRLYRRRSKTPPATNSRQDETQLPYPYRSGDDLLRMSTASGLSISQMTLANERILAARFRNPRRTPQALASHASLRQARLPPGRHPPWRLESPPPRPDLFRRLTSTSPSPHKINLDFSPPLGGEGPGEG